MVPVPTAVTVVLVLAATVATPLVGAVSVDERRDSPVETPLQADGVEIVDSVSLTRSDFGAGTYHFSPIVVRTSGLSGTGTVVVQYGVPWYRNYVSSVQRRVTDATGEDRTLRLQPRVEFPPEVIQSGLSPIRVTVRFRTAGTSRIVAERTLETGGDA